MPFQYRREQLKAYLIQTNRPHFNTRVPHFLCFSLASYQYDTNYKDKENPVRHHSYNNGNVETCYSIRVLDKTPGNSTLKKLMGKEF